MAMDHEIDSTNIDVPEYSHMYHTNLYVGSNHTKLELWISTTEHQIALFGGHECVNCNINGGFDSSISDTSYTESNNPWIETCMIYDKDSKGSKL